MVEKHIAIFLLAFVIIQSTNALDQKNEIPDDIIFPDAFDKVQPFFYNYQNFF